MGFGVVVVVVFGVVVVVVVVVVGVVVINVFVVVETADKARHFNINPDLTFDSSV